MVTINIKSNVDEFRRALDRQQREQLPFATALALTRTAKEIEGDLKRHMDMAFESASPYTTRSTFSTSATKRKLQAIVGIKDKKPAGGTAPAVLLREHFTGGERGNKPMEKAMRSIGALPGGWLVVPGAGMPLDGYGNPRRKEVAEVIGALRSRINVYKKRGKQVQTVGYFLVPVGAKSHLAPGVWKRLNQRAVVPVFLFVQEASYRKVMDIKKIGDDTVRRVFVPNLRAALAQALRTAR